jgi:membrane associated rhomboid family serine protease
VIPLKDDNPTRRLPVLTLALILACVGVFLYQSSLPADASLEGQVAFTCEFGMLPDHVLNGPDPREDLSRTVDAGTVTCQALSQEHNRFQGLLSYQFLHADWLHLLGNMLFLWVFGNNIEDRLGRLRFLPFYLLCGVAAALGQAFVDPSSDVPLIGASGAIAGMLGAYILLFPRAGVWTLVAFVIPLKVPAWLWIGIYFVLQFLYLGDSATSDGGGVAYMAHIAGFVAGFVLIRPFLAGRDEPPARRLESAAGPGRW